MLFDRSLVYGGSSPFVKVVHHNISRYWNVLVISIYLWTNIIVSYTFKD
jgi:hypothetical protein